jgi:glucokinase
MPAMITDNEITYTIGIDIGGTKISSALVYQGKIKGEIHKIKTPQTLEEIKQAVIQMILNLKDNYTTSNIGIATAGVVDVTTGQVLSATENLPTGYNSINFKDTIETTFNINTYIDNDANAAAIGEYLFGAARGTKNTIVLTIGTGIGAGIIINNKIFRGSQFAAGECGHIIISQDKDRPCTCGKHGCWEAYASGTGLTTTARIIAKKLNKNPANYDSFTVIEGIKNNNSTCLKIYNIWLEHLSSGLISLMNVFDPDSIVLGGSMAEHIDFKELNSLVSNKSPSRIEIKKAKLGNNAGIIGIASLPYIDQIKQ